MEENIIEKIAEAEQTAAEKKARAQEQAAARVAEAERAARERERTSEETCAADRAKTVEDAERRTSSDYERELEARRAEAKQYADRILGQADGYVAEIVGRIAK